MKASDTIVKTNEENCHNTLDERLDEQARITWDIAYMAGMKEVVECIKNNTLSSSEMDDVLPYGFWQAKLKEWGTE